MNGVVSADVTNMSALNLVIIFAGLIILTVVVAAVIKKFNLSISKGAIRSEDYEYDQACQTVMYHLGEDINNIDYELRRDIRRNTQKSNYSVANIGNMEKMCQAARHSLFLAFKEPFYECINNNHFTRELMPPNYEIYRSQLISWLKEAHQEYMFEYNLDSCPQNDMSTWNDVKDSFAFLADEWLIMVSKEVIKACTRKIRLYELELKNVEKSKHWSSVLNACIAKNKEYVDVLTNRLLKGEARQKKDLSLVI